MKLILRKAYIIDPNSSWHKKRADILIDKGIIQRISKTNIKESAKHEFKNVCVSGGWLDIGTHGGQPGFEHRETAASLAKTAAAGGFTGLAIMPNLLPIVDNSTSVTNIKNQSTKSVDFYPIGALSQQLEGASITEFYDMSLAGAVGFSNGIEKPISKAILLRALDYVKGFNGLIIYHPSDELTNSSQMHEGAINVQLGLKGTPAIFEKINVDQSTSLLDYSNSKMLVHLISTKLGVEAIKSAKRNKNQLFSSVSYKNLVATDEELLSFESHWKVQPPLRSANDKKALVKGIKDGVIDIIVSNHVPLEQELKAKEFSETSKGSIGLQTLFPALNQSLGDSLKIEDWIPCLSLNPYKVLGLEAPTIMEGNKANMTIFDNKEPWSYNSNNNTSKSENSPFIGQTFKGKVKAIINNQNTIINH